MVNGRIRSHMVEALCTLIMELTSKDTLIMGRQSVRMGYLFTLMALTTEGRFEILK